jgi:hypothetical protein
MPIQSCGQNVSAPRGKAGARLNAHTELRAKRQRSAREAIYRNRPIVQRQPFHSNRPTSSVPYHPFNSIREARVSVVIVTSLLSRVGFDY